MTSIKTISDMEMSENLPSSGFCVFLEINRLFGFLAHEGYEGDYFLIGREIAVSYYNHNINQRINIVIPEPCVNNGWNCKVTIEKGKFIFSKKMSITDSFLQNNSTNISCRLSAYSCFIRENFMSVVRGKEWIDKDNLKTSEIKGAQVQCVDVDELSEEEQSFWNIYFTFGFLQHEGYHCSEFCIGDKVSLSYFNHVLKQRISIFSAFPHSEWEIVIEKKGIFHSQRLFLSKLLNEQDRSQLVTLSNYIQQHLMHVIRGERWI